MQSTLPDLPGKAQMAGDNHGIGDLIFSWPGDQPGNRPEDPIPNKLKDSSLSFPTKRY
jgi:hypothetical protein